jgi:spermidine synthase
VRKAVLAGLFLISGFSGLVYEIVWTRIFGLIFGNTTLAISTVLAAYMLGLSLGAIILGRLADSIKSPLKVYALLEAGIGVSALLIPLLRNPIENFFMILYPTFTDWPTLFVLIKFCTAFLLMLPPTLLMGGTLPVLSRGFIEQEKKMGTGIGLLYGINTLGAVSGAFITAFFLIYNLGVNGSIILAAFFNFLIACLAFLLSIRSPVSPVKLDSVVPETGSVALTNQVLWVMALSGFTALSYEVLWSRILVFILTNSVYAFSIMLTAFLLGIAIGSWIGGWLTDRQNNLRFLLAGIEAGLAVTALVTAILLVNLPAWHFKNFILEPSTSWWYLNGVRFVEACLVMLLPAILMGAAFPVACRLITGRLNHLGEGLGRLYFYNTLGGVAGSFLSGFVLIKYLGTSSTLVLMVLINLLLGLFLFLYSRLQEKKNYRLITGFAVAGMIILIISFTPKTLFSVTYSATEKNYPLVDFREGIEGTVTVHRSHGPGPNNLRIDIDGLNVAGTSFMLRTLQTLQGHLPLFVHPSARDVMQIGFGTGQTSYSALRHPLENFKLVEISADVLDLSAQYFTDINQGVLRNPRFQFTIMDGKNFIRYTPDRFDIIMNDANYAVATASASLFTRDHFNHGRNKLNPGGIFSTWMTTDLDPRDFAIVLRTFQSVFPYCLLWMAPNCINKQVVLMGSAQPIQLDFIKIQKIIKQPAIRDNLSAININSAYDLLDCLVLDSAGIAGIAGQVEVNSDEYPILEFSQRDIRSRDLCAYQNLARIMARPPRWKSLLINLSTDSVLRQQVIDTLQRNQSASRQLLKGMLKFYQGRLKEALQTVLNGSRLIPESQLAAQFFRDMDVITSQLVFEAQQQPGNLETLLKLIRHQIALEEYVSALSQLQNLVLRYPQKASPLYEMARCYLAGGQLDSARMYFQQSLDLNPKLSAAWYFLGEIQRQQNKHDQALVSYRRALDLDGRMYEALNAIAWIYHIRGNYQQAIDLYHRSLTFLEWQPTVLSDLGDCYFNTTAYNEAITCYIKALQFGEPSARLFKKLGSASYMLKHYPQAAYYFRHSLELDSLDSESYYNLGNTMVMQNNLSQAVPYFQKAVQLNKAQADYFNNLAMCYNHLGRQAQALRIFNTGLKIHPGSELLKNNRAAILAIKNK